MAGLEELKKKLGPLFDADKGFPSGLGLSPCDSYMVSDGGTVNLLSRSCGVYNINELGLQKRTSGLVHDEDSNEKTYRCASHEMRIFGAIGCGASSIVQRAIHIPVHRILALKKINVFEKEKRQQLLNEIRTLCEAPSAQGLVEFHGAFYTPDSGQISIALEYMNGGSLADVLRVQKFIPEPVLASMVQKLLLGLSYLHGVRHLVHRDIKPANLLINLKGEPKITDFGISAGLENSVAMCATFVGTVTYMSPERIRNESYSYPADIWSLGLAIFECGTGEFPYTATEGPVNLMLQLLAHSFIMKHESSKVDLAAYARSVFDPTQRLRDLADMLTIHYYLLFDGSDDFWHHAKVLYGEASTFSFLDEVYVGATDIFTKLSSIRKTLVGDGFQERLVHVVESLQCCAHGNDGLAIRVSGSFIIGNHFLICGNGVQVEGMPRFDDFTRESIMQQKMGTFHEQFIMEPGSVVGCFLISKQELYILQ
ncbi:mitogen-activated protein kinase kinase 3 isoform X2 [Nymphaea colorata]|uniref:mitogen-activated protein kinase kinase 3 isoform X2 n=1 Tax=Nymphaea colorata TaxID=210225 RepID=UPI00129E3694|nr:mitogen-activated protein kinase kinase 3 isoform X2 [Nymphaea colorata]